VVLPALMRLGVGRLDVAVLTHAHQDHGGGLFSLLEAFPPREIWVGRSPSDHPLVRRLEEFAGHRGIPLIHPTRGDMKCLGTTCLEVLHPPHGYRRGAPVSNEDSLVLRVSYRRTSALLTGDVESEGESLLQNSGLELSSQILKVAHHGSASSSSSRFLAEVSPHTAIVSVGEGNPWGHPSGEVLMRLRHRGVRVVRTDVEGAVQVIGDGKRWKRRFPSP